MQVLILAGGKGTRLKKYTEKIPKPMINILGKPILLYQIESLKKYGLKDIIISVGYLGNVIKNYFKDGSKFGVNIKYVEESEPLGTGGSIDLIRNIVKDDFIVLFGDLIFNINWNKIINFHKQNKGIATFLAHSNSHPYDSDLLITDENYKIERISYKNEERNFYYKNIVKSGIHILNNRIFRYIEKNVKQDFEKDIIKRALENSENIFAYKTSEYVKDIGTLDRLDEVEKYIKNGFLFNENDKKGCIFLDRDGTINKYVGLLKDSREFQLEKNVSEAIKLINQNNYLCIVVTNQPVIARGDCLISEMEKIHNKMETLLGKKGAYLDDIYYCPHHPDIGFEGEVKELKINCECRKPKIGMIKKASEKYNIDLGKSLIIGDSTIDIMTGKNAGIKTILLKTGLAGTDKKYNVISDYCYDNLLQAVKMIF